MRFYKSGMAAVISWMFTIAAQAQSVTPNDVKLLTGAWVGSLTYLDYGTGKPYTMPSQVVITPVANSRQILFSNVYPNEPQANHTDTVTLADDGRRIGNEKVTRRTVMPNGHIEIVTEYLGTDGNDHKQALIKTTYVVGKNLFTKKKEVQFAGETVWVKRHEYLYTK